MQNDAELKIEDHPFDINFLREKVTELIHLLCNFEGRLPFQKRI